MEIANQIFFLVFALLTFTFFLSFLWSIKFSKADSTNTNLLISVGLYGLCCLSFGLAPWASNFLLTIANTCYVAANIALVILYSKWNQEKLSWQAITALWCIPLIIACFYEPLRTTVNSFSQRVALITVSQEILLLWQAILLLKFFKNGHDRVIQLVLGLTLVNFFVSVTRTYLTLTAERSLNIFLYSEEPIAFGIRWTGFTSVLLVYIMLGIYFLQKQVEKKQELQGAVDIVKNENQEISRLLHEKELLINSLLKVNKTVETGALSASIAHELNQPLGASSINIEFLQQKLAQNKLSPESAQEILGQLASDNLRASNIIKSLRGIFARDTTITGQHDINALIQNVLSFTKPELAAHQIKVNLELAPEVSAPINSSEIQQVLVNLLNNSINAISNQDTLGNGLITIQSVATDQEIRITISDNGPGISPERKDQLFDIFSGETKFGMGLGLWLCHHIITRHNGKIWHENMPTQGARFIIILPKVA